MRVRIIVDYLLWVRKSEVVRENMLFGYSVFFEGLDIRGYDVW